MPTLDRDKDGGVALRCGNSDDVGRSLFFLPLPSFFLSWLSLLARVRSGRPPGGGGEMGEL